MAAAHPAAMTTFHHAADTVTTAAATIHATSAEVTAFRDQARAEMRRSYVDAMRDVHALTRSVIAADILARVPNVGTVTIEGSYKKFSHITGTHTDGSPLDVRETARMVNVVKAHANDLEMMRVDLGVDHVVLDVPVEAAAHVLTGDPRQDRPA